MLLTLTALDWCNVLCRLLLVVKARGKARSAVVARGVVPLYQLVQDHYSTQPWSTISINMELNGLPLGKQLAVLLLQSIAKPLLQLC
jgi:hypothetical protein